MSDLPRPNDQVRAYWQQHPPAPGFLEMSVAQMRSFVRAETLAVCGPPQPVAAVDSVHAGGVAARMYHPERESGVALVWLHGGGWMFGDLDCYDSIARILTNAVPCTVISVDYRLAPEHPFPAAIDDAWNATVWACNHFDRVAIGGDSAGGNLAAAVALRCSDRGIKLAHQLLIYPVLDCLVDSPSYIDFASRYRNFAPCMDFGAETRDRLRHIWEAYVPEASNRCLRDAAPLRAESVDGLPPTTIITAEHDILRGEADAYARRLRDAHIDVRVLNYERQIHGFVSMLDIMDDGRDALQKAAAAVATSLH